MKIYTLEQGQVKAARKSLNFEQFLTSLTMPDRLSKTAYGLAYAYSASVWAYRAIQLRAKAIGGIAVQVVDANGEKLAGHPVQAFFGDTGSALLEQIEVGLCVHGVAYLEKMENDFDQIAGLKWLNPLAVSPVKTGWGIESFLYAPGYGGPQVKFMPDNIVYLQTVNPLDDLGGLSPLEVALNAVNVDRDTIRYAQSFFANGARLDGILTVPDATDDVIDAVESKWKRVFRGVKNAFRTLIVGGIDIKYTPITPPPKDVVLAEIKSEQRRDICAAFGVPPALAGAWESSNFATAQESRRSFYTETILPELDFIEDGLNRQLMAEHFPDAFIRFDLSAIEALQENEAERNTAISTAYQAGWLTVNEARERAGLPPIEGGDALRPPINQDAVPGGAADPFRFNADEGRDYP